MSEFLLFSYNGMEELKKMMIVFLLGPLICVYPNWLDKERMMKYNGLVLNKFTEIPFMSLEANFKIHNFNITYKQIKVIKYKK